MQKYKSIKRQKNRKITKSLKHTVYRRRNPNGQQAYKEMPKLTGIQGMKITR